VPVRTLWFSELNAAAASEVRRLLLAYRAALFARLVGPALDIAQTSSDGEVGRGLGAYFEQIQRRSQAGSDLPARHLAHWSPTFLLQRIVHPACSPDMRARLVQHLLVRLMLDAAGAEDRLDRSLALPGPSSGQLIDLDAFKTFQLPAALADGDPCGFEKPLSRARRMVGTLPSRFGSRLVGDCRLLGVDAAAKARPGAGAKARVLTFRRSIDEAHALLETAWPEAVQWVRLLVPAFADLGRPPSADLTRSESYGPGCPIFLTRAPSGWNHAEDIVHEVQHHRFHLWILDRPFRSLSEETPRFVSPWRADVRPLYGLHLGLHAFVTVNQLRVRLQGRLTTRLRDEFVQTHVSNLFAFRSILEHDDPTDEGRRYLVTVARALLEHDRLFQAFATPEVTARIDAAFAGHCSRLSGSNGRLKNAGEAVRNRHATLGLATHIMGGGADAH